MPVLPQKQKGQLSAETLAVFLIFISILGIAAVSISKVVEKSDQNLSRTLGKSSFDDVSSAIEDACFLGSGNVRTLPLPPGGARVSASGKSLSFSSGGFASTAIFDCEFRLMEKNLSGEIRIENAEGEIEIS